MARYTNLFKNFPQVFEIDTVKCFSIINKAEVDVFMESPFLFYDPTNVGNLISGSSAFYKPSLDISKFLVCIMLKPSMQDFKHDLMNMEMSVIV